MKTGIICDEIFFNNSIDNGVMDLEYISRKNYSNNYDVIIYVTTFYGIDNSWFLYGKKHIDAVNEVFQMNPNAKKIFISKEDPTNFEKFKDIAKICDIIFTTDEDSIQKYQNITNHSNIFTFKFFFNPSISNPIGCYDYIENTAAFCGSFYKQYSERCYDTKQLLDRCIDNNYELFIYNRFYGNEGWNFPEKYTEFEKENVSYLESRAVSKKAR